MGALKKEREAGADLTEEMRRTARGMRAARDRRVEKLLRLLRIGNDERLPVDRRGDVRRLADRFEQELTDFAEMRVGVARNAQRCEVNCRVMKVVVVCATGVVAMIGAAMDDREAMMMPRFGHQLVQTFAQESNAGVRRQQ
jgi:hypothetical protein